MPAAAQAVFADRTEQVQRFAELLAGPGVERGLIGPREGAVLWTRHLMNSAALLGFLPAQGGVLDLGSGAGLPGVVLALARPDLSVILLDPMARRCAFLTEVVDELGLTQVQVVRGRAEDVVGRVQADAVVARAVAPLARLVPIALPLLIGAGPLLALKGADAAAEVEAAAGVLKKADARAEICPVAVPGTTTTTTVVRILVNLR